MIQSLFVHEQLPGHDGILVIWVKLPLKDLASPKLGVVQPLPTLLILRPPLDNVIPVRIGYGSWLPLA